MIREIDETKDVVIQIRNTERIVVNGKYFELHSIHDKIYDDLKYVQYDGELWVEE